MWAGSLGALDIKKVTPWLATLFTKSIGSISIGRGWIAISACSNGTQPHPLFMNLQIFAPDKSLPTSAVVPAIRRLIAKWVGPSGHVHALDINSNFVSQSRDNATASRVATGSPHINAMDPFCHCQTSPWIG